MAKAWLLGLGLAGCSAGAGHLVLETTDDRMLRAIQRTADGAQAGRVVALDGRELVLDPGRGAAADLVRVTFTEATPVFRDGRQVTLRELKSGAEVFVPYRQTGQLDAPRAVAIVLRDHRR